MTLEEAEKALIPVLIDTVNAKAPKATSDKR
jgi:hypothetical protein